MTSDATRAGKNRSFLSLFFPVLAMTFSTSIYLMVEKLLLGFSSRSAMEAAVAVASIVQVFQLGTVAIAMMAQVFIGERCGEQNYRATGPCLWQFIWFSLLSTILVTPIGILYGYKYLKGMPFEGLAKPYLCFVLLINFLYPLGIALSCFFIAQAKTRLVLFSTIGSQILKVTLAYFTIPSLTTKNPLWGLYGGAITTFLAQGTFCSILLWAFLHPRRAKIYNSHDWKFRPRLFWQSIYPGTLRAINKILNGLCWASISYLMITKTETHIAAFSVGAVIFSFLPFLSDAVCQTQTVIISRLVGAKKYFDLIKALKPGTLWTSLALALFTIPFLLFPQFTFEYLFPTILLNPQMVRTIFWGLWFSFAFFTLACVPLGYILAFKDMYFSAFMGCFGWLNGFLLMYYFMNIANIAPQYFWLALSIMHGSNFIIYFLRALWLCHKATKRYVPV